MYVEICLLDNSRCSRSNVSMLGGSRFLRVVGSGNSAVRPKMKGKQYSVTRSSNMFCPCIVTSNIVQ